MFQSAAGSLVASAFWTATSSTLYALTTPLGSSPEHPIAVVGAGSRTGIEVVKALAKDSLYTVTLTRTGKEPPAIEKMPQDLKQFVFHFAVPMDVRNKEDFKRALIDLQPSAIVYCASASAQGGTAQEVDSDGLALTAEAARDLGALLVDISVLGVGRPNSVAYQKTNAFEGNLKGMMDAKLEGEKRIRDILRIKKNYIILRPGSFINGSTKNGPIDIEINQGDTIGGGISVDEVAGVIVGALKSGRRGITVEAYRRSLAFPLLPSLNQPSGNERYSDTYEGLFSSVKPDS